MAAADLRAELTCSICREIYTDPVTLSCGHNFCLICIGKTWDWQESIEEDPSCPECRKTYRIKPELQRNLTLRNIAEQFLSTHPEEDGTEIPENMKCSTHHKYLEYYCCEDGSHICVFCWQMGGHRGHRVELLSEASEKKKEKLRKVLEKLWPKREETERRAQRLQECRREVAEKAAGETERVTALFRGIREWLEALEKQLLSDISSQKEELSLQLCVLTEQLEIKKDELSRKIRHIEELCNMADPLTVLQERESHAFCGTEGPDYVWCSERDDIELRSVGDLDVDLISETLLTGLSGIVTGVEGRWYPGQEATDLLLDINTAHNKLSVSEDRKSASYLSTELDYPQSPERFQCLSQVLSTRRFLSGRHYWEVEISEWGCWRVGVAYPSIERREAVSCIGNNNKSWSLCKLMNNYTVTHNNKIIDLPHMPFCRRIRISLDYEAGRLSFFELSEPIRHLHTFTAKFTEPLHAAFGVGGINSWLRITI